MQTFNYKFKEAAIHDLIDIVEHLNGFSPKTAAKYYDLIHEKAKALTIFPMARPLVRDERLRELGIRWTFANNYMIFFSVDEENSLVLIERIRYSRMEHDTII
jgi:plasmid stabilization system protein ParE